MNIRSQQRGFTAIELFVVVLSILCIGGWVANIVKLVGMGIDPITTMLVVRAIGIFVAPLGVVLDFI